MLRKRLSIILRMGRNQVDQFIDNFQDAALGATVTDVIIYDYAAPTGGLGPDEARVNWGDSGAPSFLSLDGQPALVGLHWFQYDAGEFGNNPGSGDSFVPSYISSINAGMVGEKLTLVSVPEPSALLLCGLPLVMLRLVRRKRASQSNAASTLASADDERRQAWQS